ncbi:MAG: protein translocase SEC61 complex subunit gamma [Candidatus Aenigmarchaeota archaeon]|nr:protein translocase SEC61 complex subunit gamma [Candidatus Aenigmarchaeota archaeon]
MSFKDWFSPVKIKEKLAQYRRVISITRKPDKDEFLGSLKVTGIGLLLIGFIGFVMFLLYHLAIGSFW